MRVLQVVESLDPSFGGTAVSITQLVNQLAEHGVDVAIFLPDRSNTADRLHPQIRVCQSQFLARRKISFALRLGRDLATLGKCDLVHIHGLWRLHYAQISRFAHKHGLPVVLSTHGMLEPSALGHHGWGKRVARILYQDIVLKGVQCFHTTASSEADSLYRLGLRRPTAIIPWGIYVPRQDQLWTISRSKAGGRRTALYLSRFHPIKGLDLLLRAWSAVEKSFPQWDLVLAGYDENGYRMHLQALTGSLGISRRVFFRGPLVSKEKEAAFADAEIFLLPSRSENFGLAVGEALARGLPVITTTGTPWSSVADWDCGWYVEPSVPAITQALVAALGQPGPKLRQMGERGRELVLTRFSIATSGKAMVDLYAWLLGDADRPTFVRPD
jgi:glycosyltransferase involved in cell wall biosynthesis